MITDDDCLSSEYDPEDDNGNTDDDEDEFQASESVSLPILNQGEERANIFRFNE